MSQFVEILNAFGRWLVGQLWQMSIELTILAGVVLAVLYLLRVKSPTLRHAFWCLVLAKPVATFLIASPVSLYWFLQPPPEPPEPPVVAPGPPVSDAPAYMHRRPMGMRPEYRATPPIAPVEAPPAWKQLDSHGAVGLAWSVIAFALFLRLVIGCAYVAFLRQTSTTQSDGPLPELVDQVARAFKIRRRVAVAISEVPHGPVLAGILRPMILLPRRLVEMMSVEQTQLIIAHEMAHVRRRDNLLLLIQRLAEMFLFFHPVVWVCGWILRREAEAACDDAVIAAYGGSTAYADSLTRVAEMKCGLTRRLLVNTFAAAESNFSQRVRRILDERVGRMRLGLSVAAVVALVVVACFGLPTASARKAALEGTDEEAAMQKEGQDATQPIDVTKLTDAQKERLLQWQNMFGWSLEKCVQGAERTPLIRVLLAEELSLRALSDDAQVIRQSMTGLEPADLTYWGKVGGVISAIGTHPLPEGSVKNGTLVLPLPGWEQRKEEVARQVKAMQLWSAGTPLVEARKDAASDAAIVEVVYGLLGDPDATKRRLAGLAIEKLTDEIDVAELEALGKDEKLKDFVHRLEMLDIQLWSHDRNFKILLGDIGRGEVTGDWHEPGGPLAWHDGDPADAPRVVAAAEALETWLEGERSDHEFVQGLRRPDAYKEKVWLVRCLLAHLRDHQAAYYPIGDRRAQDTSAPTPNGSAAVKREGHRVLIEGVPRLKRSDGKECTFAGALEAALAVTAHPHSYADIMGLTGLAFRVRWSNEDTKTKWCGSCAIGEMPDELTDVGRLTGWPLPTDTQFGEDQPDTGAIRRKIVTSIDAGRPVMAYASCLEMAVIYGYADGGGTLLVSDYKIDQPFRLPVEKIGPLQTYLGKRAGPPPRRDALIEALKTAVVNWRRQRHDGGIDGREYLYGDAALHAWLHDLSAADDLPKKKKEVFFRLNGWNYRSLKDARAAASAFLKEHASLLGDEARTALGRAVELYQDELDYLDRWEKTHRSWSVESVDAWTDRIRNRQRESLLVVHRKEEEAIAEIEKALAAEGIDVSAAIANAMATGAGEKELVGALPAGRSADGERVKIEGVPDHKIGRGWHMLLEGMQILLEHRGEKPTLNELMAYSGDAFNLCHGTQWELRIPLAVPTDTLTNVAKAYGYAARWIPPRWFHEVNKLDKKAKQRLADEYLGQIWQEVDRGRPVLMGGAYGECGDWRVVVGYDPGKELICYVGGDSPYDWTAWADPKVKEFGFWDSQVRGPLRPGFFGGWQANTAFLLQGKQTDVSPRDRCVAALERAVALFGGGAHATDAYGGVTYSFGQEAYEQWGKDLHELTYPADLAGAEKRTGDFYVLNTLLTQVDQIVRGRTAAAEFCEQAAEELSEGGRQLGVAERHYHREVQIARDKLGVFLQSKTSPPDDTKAWRDAGLTDAAKKWLTSEASREAGVAAIEAMLVEERAAVAAIAEALTAEGVKVAVATAMASRPPSAKARAARAKVRKKDDRVIIPDVPRPKGLNSTLASLASILQSVGEDVTYEHLMGVSSHAFRLQFGWCPSNPHSHVGFNTFKPALEAIGYKATELPVAEFEGHQPKAPAQAKLEKARRAVRASIDEGLPVLFGSEECGVIAGYGPVGADDKTGWLRRPGPIGDPPEADEPYVEPINGRPWGVKGIPWGVQVLSKSTAGPPSSKDRILWSLKTAVENAHRGDVNGLPIGLAAWDKWIAELKDFDKPQRETTQSLAKQNRPHSDADVLSSLCIGNAWCFESLIEARRAAATYLRSVAAEFKDASRDHLRQAATHYDTMTKRLTKKCPTDVAPYPWMLKGKKTWTDAMRRGQADILKDALALEHRAIEEIERALAAERIDVQRVAARPYPESAMLENVPGGKAHYDAFAGGLSIALSYSGIPTDYDTLMGDLGTAFILQASDQAAKYEGALDAGWWPLAWDCLPALLEQVAPTLGVRVEWVGGEYNEYKTDPAKYYRDKLDGTVKASIASGRPVLENHRFWEVVVGYDGQELPLLSFCPRSPDGKQRIGRLTEHPVAVAVLGDAVPRLGRKKADLEALKRAVALGRDQIPMPNGYRTGQSAFALWAETLRDTKHLGQARWHANVVGHLGRHRRSAVAYLRAMAERHSEKTAWHLKAAADLYERGVSELNKADTSEDALIKSTRGREALARLAERIAALELKAITEMEQALRAEGIDVEVPKMAMGRSAQSVTAGRQLPGLEQKRMWVTHMGCLIGCAEYLKADASSAWIWGTSGHAFALNVHEVICPSGPTAWAAEKCDALAANAGLQIEDLRADKRQEGFAKKQEEIWRKACQAMDAGLPCFGWELNVPDWYVITGYDADGHYLFTEFDGKPGKKHHTKLGDSEIGVACVLVVKPGKAKPDRTAVREALVFALDHAAGKHSHDLWHTGLSGYDTWVKALQDDKRVKDEEVIGFGHAYNAACWSECRKQAVAFLEEAKKRLDDEKLSPQFDEAIKRYKMVSANLDAVAKTFPFNVREQKRMREQIQDAARRAKAVKALQTAREAERAGLKALARIAVSLGAKGALGTAGWDDYLRQEGL